MEPEKEGHDDINSSSSSEESASDNLSSDLVSSSSSQVSSLVSSLEPEGETRDDSSHINALRINQIVNKVLEGDPTKQDHPNEDENENNKALKQVIQTIMSQALALNYNQDMRLLFGQVFSAQMIEAIDSFSQQRVQSTSCTSYVILFKYGIEH